MLVKLHSVSTHFINCKFLLLYRTLLMCLLLCHLTLPITKNICQPHFTLNAEYYIVCTWDIDIGTEGAVQGDSAQKE